MVWVDYDDGHAGGYPHECKRAPKKWQVKKSRHPFNNTHYWLVFYNNILMYRMLSFHDVVMRWRFEETGRYRSALPALHYPDEGYCFNVDDEATWMTPTEAVDGVNRDPSFEDRQWLMETPC